MSRNKHPEETVEKIVVTARRLFFEKGYEHTSLQDIIDNLGGLTKGAIYHHFKSKEEIMFAVMDKIYEKHDTAWEQIIADQSVTGLEKLRRLIKASLLSPSQNEIFTSAPDFTKNPQMLVMQLESIFNEAAPNYLEPIIRQGVKDGSIQTEYPRQLAEAILILSNIWLNPMVAYAPPAELTKRCHFLNHALEAMGLALFDQEMFDRAEEIASLYTKNK